MEINQNNKPVTVTFSDGTVKQVIYDSIEFLEGGMYPFADTYQTFLLKRS